MICNATKLRSKKPSEWNVISRARTTMFTFQMQQCLLQTQQCCWGLIDWLLIEWITFDLFSSLGHFKFQHYFNYIIYIHKKLIKSSFLKTYFKSYVIHQFYNEERCWKAHLRAIWNAANGTVYWRHLYDNFKWWIPRDEVTTFDAITLEE